jgi:hypothetical protein
MMDSPYPLHRWIRTLLVAIVALLTLMLGIVLLKVTVRALPGRYAYYLPTPLQELRHVPHADVLPTPVIETTPPQTLVLPTPTSPPPTATATPLPTHSVTPAPTATGTSTPIPQPTLPITVHLEGGRQERQGWNNCGPTTLAMQLSFWGCEETQAVIAPVLKPDPEDKNVGPYEMAEYARSQGYEALVRPGGNVELLRRLVAAGFPVVVETWHIHEPDDQMGHYRLIVGYDDLTETFATYDSLATPEVHLSYAAMDELWRAFNRLFLLVYPPDYDEQARDLLGPLTDETTAFRRALGTAYAEVQDPPATCVAYVDCADAATFAWFNVGTNLLRLGRPQDAAAAYDQARALGVPYRILWYQFGPYEAYYAVGRYEDVIALADQTLRVTPNLEESYYWRGQARLALGDIKGARADFEAALRYHKGWSPAQAALEALPE